ncbi:YfhO family protein [Nocardia cyriacigeorgica]|uniref:YfhO family protein n=1 Tax=Nocardia cyriacigeorgica TaxID=135487 RepID=UPI001E56DBDE|nr:YfhO family protein [Nocardia cyriacigeorgica]
MYGLELVVESRAGTRSDVFRWGIITAAGVVVAYLAVLAANVRHFYTDDTESQYAPLWVMTGRYLREGRFPAMVPEHWLAGNYTIEEAGLLNPPQLLIDLIAPSVPDIGLYATVVKLIFAVILGLGVYRVALAYGAGPAWSAVAGVSFPFTGFLLFFDAASWMTAFTGTAWLVHAWASGVRYARGRSGPIPVFVFLYLAISVQYIFPAVEAGVMIAAVIIGEVVYQRSWAPSLRLALVAGCAALAGLATYLPSLLTADVTWRGADEIKNDPFLTVPWSESLNASLPSTLPAFTSWWGFVQPLPMVYIAWFLIPALAFVDWRRAAGAARELSALGIFTVAALLWTAGPGTMGPLRWPARVLPMVALGLLLLVCVLLGRYGTTAGWRRRGIGAGLLIGVLLLRSLAAAPSEAVWHIVSALGVAALGAAVVWLGRTRGTALACALSIVAVAPIAYLQVRAAQPTPMSWNLPADRSEAKAAFPDFGGTTLQLGERGLIQPGQNTLDEAYGSLVFGNYAKDLELTYVGGYTPNGHFYFGELLCMRWDTSVCPDAYRRAFATEPDTGRTIVDLMKIDRVVLQRALFPDARAQPAPTGWRWVDYPGHEDYIWVLEREDGPVSAADGRIAHTDGVTATSLGETDLTSRVRVDSAEGGKVVFARLGWPGYRASIDGRDVPISVVAKTFVAVEIPPGTQGAELVLSWRPPGWKIGGAAIVAGLLGLAALEWAYLRGRRRDTDEPAADSSTAPEAPEPERPDLVEARP